MNNIKIKKERSDEFYRLLHEIEYVIGSECYNGNIQNYGPGGEWEGEGRSFRYPVTFIDLKSGKKKYKTEFPFLNVDGNIGFFPLGSNRYNSAYYAFGANQLYILRGIKHALEKLERRFGFDFDELLENENNEGLND